MSAHSKPAPAASRLLSLYTRTTLWYLLVVALFSILGVEAIYMNPTPFHALFTPPTGAWGGPVFAAGLIAAAAFLLLCYFSPGSVLTPHRKALIGGGAFLWLVALTGILSQDAGLRSGADTLSSVLWAGTRWHVPAIVVAFSSAAAGLRWLTTHPVLAGSAKLPSARKILLILVLFSAVFSASIAMIRGGAEGITGAYERSSYEYIGDIGIRTSIKAFFHDYNELHDYLSMHSKVHPPGPVVILWLLSTIVFSQGPFALSLATIAVGSTAVIPLFLWVRDMVDERVALLSAVLYVLMPSIVLFTATSADILFTPLTLWTLFLFWRAIHRNSWKYAVGAGALYAAMSLCSFSLLAIGAFFGLVGLWRLRDRTARLAVIKTAALMIASFLAVHLAVRYWSGFDIIECFRLSKAQFDEDQANLDIYTPRYPGWVFRFLNPMAWFFFAGIPVSVLFCWRLFRPERSRSTIHAMDEQGSVGVPPASSYAAGVPPASSCGASVPPASSYATGVPPASSYAAGVAPASSGQGDVCGRSTHFDRSTKPLFIIFALTLFALNLMYLGRGEGERSAMYILPFVVIPAAHVLHEIGQRTRSNGPAAVTFAFLAIQCWAVETCLYTYW